MKQFVVKKESVDFWLDENGIWQNRHGPFKHRRIIDHFHQSIRCDESGYYLLQTHGESVQEKVYFPHRDTALFIFDLIDRGNDDLLLVLNTGTTLLLDPESLCVEKDQLYLDQDGHRIRFTAKALLKLSEYLRLEAEAYQIVLKRRTINIPECPMDSL